MASAAQSVRAGHGILESAWAALAAHWPEYLMEAAELGLFMLSACCFAVLLEHPASPLRQALPDAKLRRVLMGVAMGSTAVTIVYSPLGKRSGAHFNPSVTLTFLLLGKVRGWDALFYAVSQLGGGIAGVLTAVALLGPAVRHAAVNFVVTAPGPSGPLPAFLAELAISFGLMLAVLTTSNSRRWARFTPVVAGLLVASFITIEAPISGMSMNPARTFASALPARYWKALWIYFTAPPLGMILAGAIYRWRRGISAVYCAKLHHRNPARCIFRCNYAALSGEG